MQRWRWIVFAVVAGCGVASQVFVFIRWLLESPATTWPPRSDLLPGLFMALGVTWMGLVWIPPPGGNPKRALAKQALALVCIVIGLGLSWSLWRSG